MSCSTELARRMLAQGSQPSWDRYPHPIPRQNLGRKAQVLVVVHGWMPYLAAGSERMMQHLIDALPRDEFDIEILSFGYGIEDPADEHPYFYDDLPVTIGYTPVWEPDVIITHHGPGARVTGQLTQEFPDARIIAVYHNERYDIPDIQGLRADLEIFNTDWVRETLSGNGLVVHPPLEPERHAVSATGDKVTMVNLQENKGVRIFADLARRMPEVEFLAVEGTHGDQELYLFRDLPNVTHQSVTQDMREVWRQTRLVLMMSEYESYGMVAAEACVNGIPVIANPTEGLVECLGWGGLFIPREDINAYERTIRLLMTDPETYRVHHETALIHGRDLAEQSRRELPAFVDAVRGLV